MPVAKSTAFFLTSQLQMLLSHSINSISLPTLFSSNLFPHLMFVTLPVVAPALVAEPSKSISIVPFMSCVAGFCCCPPWSRLSLRQDHGHECPFFEGAKHRFKDVQSLPEAQLRESTSPGISSARAGQRYSRAKTAGREETDLLRSGGGRRRCSRKRSFWGELTCRGASKGCGFERVVMHVDCGNRHVLHVRFW